MRKDKTVSKPARGHAKPNWNWWERKTLWTIFEAASLYSGVEPVAENEALEANNSNEQLHQMYEHLKDATDLWEHRDNGPRNAPHKLPFIPPRTRWVGNRRITPFDFAAWLKDAGHPIPEKLKPFLKKTETVSEAERTTLNNIINAMRELVLGECPDAAPHPSVGKKLTNLVSLLNTEYHKKRAWRGMSERTLYDKFQDAKRYCE